MSDVPALTAGVYLPSTYQALLQWKPVTWGRDWLGGEPRLRVTCSTIGPLRAGSRRHMTEARRHTQMYKQELPSEDLTAQTTLEEPEQPSLATLTIVTLSGRMFQERIPSALVPQEQALCAELLQSGAVKVCMVTL
jgi:hypothetical protein